MFHERTRRYLVASPAAPASTPQGPSKNGRTHATAMSGIVARRATRIPCQRILRAWTSSPAPTACETGASIP